MPQPSSPIHASESSPIRASRDWCYYRTTRGGIKATAFRGERSMRLNSLLVAGFAALCAGEAAAHHSFAMFDPEKLITQTGTVKELEWTNPHVWLHVIVP